MTYPQHWGIVHISRHGPSSGSVCYQIRYYVTNRHTVIIPMHWQTRVKNTDKYALAELVREKIYQTGCIHDQFCHSDITVSRSVADRIYRQALWYSRAGIVARFRLWIKSRLFASREWEGVRKPSIRRIGDLV